MEHETTTAHLATDVIVATEAGQVDGTLLVDELLVEEISIDGMCGVY